VRPVAAWSFSWYTNSLQWAVLLHAPQQPRMVGNRPRYLTPSELAPGEATETHGRAGRVRQMSAGRCLAAERRGDR
jgi:hypothetical protein